jgi:hypothetical protein
MIVQLGKRTALLFFPLLARQGNTHPIDQTSTTVHDARFSSLPSSSSPQSQQVGYTVLHTAQTLASFSPI